MNFTSHQDREGSNRQKIAFIMTHRIYDVPITSETMLRRRIRKVCRNLEPGLLMNLAHDMKARVRECIAVKGGATKR